MTREKAIGKLYISLYIRLHTPELTLEKFAVQLFILTVRVDSDVASSLLKEEALVFRQQIT